MSHIDVVLAYIDPGAGALIIQAIIASVLTFGVVGRRIIFAPFLAIFRKSETAARESDAENSDDD